MSVSGYQTISNPSEGIFKDKGSTFVALAYPVKNEEDVKKFLQEARKAHPKCNHHCYAFRLTPDGSLFRSSDDREPSGSAGKPILNQLISHQLTDILIVVARYFGGSLLGVPGLINAYRSAAEQAIANANIIYCTVNVTAGISFPYLLLNPVMQFLKNSSFKLVSEEYDETVNLTIDLPIEAYHLFLEQLSSYEAGYQVQTKIISPSVS
jgi:uncharacterized YigZ family protein